MNSIYMHDVSKVEVGAVSYKSTIASRKPYGIQHITITTKAGVETDIALFYADEPEEEQT